MPSMNSNTLFALGAVVAVALLALLLRRGGVTEVTSPPPALTEEPEPADDADDEDSLEVGEAAAITSDGVAFVGEAHSVRLVPVEHDAGLKAAPSANVPMVGERLNAGDFTAARVVRGAPDHDPWRLELLGREGEFMTFAFETREAANTAMELLEKRGVVRSVLDNDGNRVPTSPEQFAEARRIYDETEESLAMTSDEDLEPR
jgi:hypothetical protein